MTFKLYYSKVSCGAANFIVASLGNLEFDSEQVDLGTKKTTSGADFLSINPKGNVPTITFDDSNKSILNENAATLTFLADQSDVGLAPKEGTPERYEYLNALGFVNSELHPAFGKLFNPTLDDVTREKAKAATIGITKRFFDLVVKGKQFVMGDKPNAADIYAYIVLSWAPFVGVDLAQVEEAKEYSERIAAYPGVKEAHAKMEAASN